ncbi:hypothetical protein HK099_002076, partial [Clydaea vesicula]
MENVDSNLEEDLQQLLSQVDNAGNFISDTMETDFFQTQFQDSPHSKEKQNIQIKTKPNYNLTDQSDILYQTETISQLCDDFSNNYDDSKFNLTNHNENANSTRDDCHPILQTEFSYFHQIQRPEILQQGDFNEKGDIDNLTTMEKKDLKKNSISSSSPICQTVNLVHPTPIPLSINTKILEFEQPYQTPSRTSSVNSSMKNYTTDSTFHQQTSAGIVNSPFSHFSIHSPVSQNSTSSPYPQTTANSPLSLISCSSFQKSSLIGTAHYPQGLNNQQILSPFPTPNQHQTFEFPLNKVNYNANYPETNRKSYLSNEVTSQQINFNNSMCSNPELQQQNFDLSTNNPPLVVPLTSQHPNFNNYYSNLNNQEKNLISPVLSPFSSGTSSPAHFDFPQTIYHSSNSQLSQLSHSADMLETSNHKINSVAMNIPDATNSAAGSEDCNIIINSQHPSNNRGFDQNNTLNFITKEKNKNFGINNYNNNSPSTQNFNFGNGGMYNYEKIKKNNTELELITDENDQQQFDQDSSEVKKLSDLDFTRNINKKRQLYLPTTPAPQQIKLFSKVNIIEEVANVGGGGGKGSKSTSKKKSTTIDTSKIAKRVEFRDGKEVFCCAFFDCIEEFSNEYLLASHQIKHTQIKCFGCTKCEKKFGRHHDALRHVKNVHKISPNDAKVYTT